MTDAAAKRRFGPTRLDIDTLAAYQFNVSTRLGTILIDQDDLADLPGIKTVFSALFGERASLIAALDDQRLWVLTQQRHLIVHRRAIVDQRYREQTGSDVPIGEVLPLKPADLYGYIDACSHAVYEIVAAVVDELGATAGGAG